METIIEILKAHLVVTMVTVYVIGVSVSPFIYGLIGLPLEVDDGMDRFVVFCWPIGIILISVGAVVFVVSSPLKMIANLTKKWFNGFSDMGHGAHIYIGDRVSSFLSKLKGKTYAKEKKDAKKGEENVDNT